MPCIARPARAYCRRSDGANQSRPSQPFIAARACSSLSRNGSCACGLIWRATPVSVTIGEAQNGHSLACSSSPSSICAPQLGHWAKRASCISAGGSPRSAARRSSSGIGPRRSGIASSWPQCWHLSLPDLRVEAQVRAAGGAGEAVVLQPIRAGRRAKLHSRGLSRRAGAAAR